jgi:gliding motility-associated-like protein
MKQFSRLSLIFVLSLSYFAAFAQRGVHGSVTITTANVIINEYTALSATALAGSNTITVTNSSLNANSRFATTLQPGDLLMIYTTQGATLNGSLTGNIAFPLDTSWGRITNYNSCGRYEFAQVRSVPNATSIVLDCNLSNTYTVGGTSRSQVIRVPRYNSLTISTGTVTCDDWNGAVGGVLVAEVLNNTVITTANGMNATGKGFRGGDLVGDNVAQFGVNNVGSTDPLFGAAKGEGICGSQFDYDPMGGRYGRGAPGNAGGGGCAHNAGGGGGANGGVIANWKGLGVPDPNVAYTAAWNLEPPINTITTLSTLNSSGGGKGGYTFSGSNQNAGTTAPGNSAWGGDSRNWQSNGYGGRPLDYTTGRLFMGGGGGAGDQNEGYGGNGGDGGGLVFLMCFGSVSGAGSIVSNGNNGNNAQGTPPNTSYSGKDGAGGGGGGGTIVINALGTITGISATANGGNGGNQVMVAGPFYFGTIPEAEGPGGGGGGGYIAVSSGVITRTTNGGNNGTTTSPALSEFPPNGATRGGVGTNNATITNYNITASNVSICSGQTATLTAAFTGTPPVGGTLIWYDAPVAGNTLGTGTSFTTPTLTLTTTYYVGSCPGWFRVPVTVTINAAPLANAGADQTICAGNPVTLTASGGGTYVWNGGTLVNASGASQNVSPATTTTYTVVVTGVGGCTATDLVQVIVSPAPIANAGLDQTICNGQSATLTASGGGTYTWNGGSLVNATGATQTVSPTTTTTYTVTAAVGLCTSTDQITVTVNSSPTASAGADQTICAGSPVTVTATGGGTYSWNGGTLVNAAGASQNVTPATTTTYTVVVTAANGCTASDQVLINVNSLPVASAGVDQTICGSSSVTLTASGGGTYVWNGGVLVNAAGASQNVSPSATTTYTVVVTGANGCTASDQVSVFVNAPPVAICNASINPICSGDTTILSATACNTCTYAWSPAVNLSSTNTQTTNANPNSTTTYILTVVDGNGCIDTASVQVVVNATPVAVAGNDMTICNGDSTQLNASGGGSYSWLPNTNLTSNAINNPIAFPTATTTYTLTVTAPNGCTDTDDLLITVNAVPVANAGADVTICSGATTQLNGSGTGNYAWTPSATLSNPNIPNPDASPAVTTTYVVTVSSAAGCNDVDSVTVIVNPTPVVTAGNDVSICANSSIQLNASGATNYVWTPATGLSDDSIANPVASPLLTTTYVVTGTTAAGCVDTDTLIVTVANQLTVTASNDAWICSGNSTPISVNTVSGATYAWTPSGTLSNAALSNPVATPTTTTTYVVLVTDPNGCQGQDSVTVNVSGPISLAASNAVTICIGQNTSISATPSGGIGPYTYAWSNSLTGAGPHTVSPVTTTTYTVSVTDSLGCVSATQSITVTVNPPLNLSVLGATTICSGDTATLSVSPTGGDGNYTVNWTPGNFTTNSIAVNPATTTTYTVTVTDGCSTPSATANVTVTVNQAPVVTMSADALTGCAPLCVNFTGQSSGNCASVAWDFGDLNSSNQQNPNNCYTQAGSYSVTFTCTDAIGCIGTVTIPNMITVNPVPVAAFTSDAPNNLIVLQSGGTAQVCFIDNSQAATTWNWLFDNGTSTQQSPCFQVNDTGYYCAELIVQSAGGCADTTELCIDVENEAVFSIPNVFTPNADGNNDLFTITATGVKAITCELYDRWGVKIYTWDGVSGGWDGRSTSGQQAVDGVYFYVATITDFNNKIIEKQGFVQLVNNK